MELTDEHRDLCIYFVENIITCNFSRKYGESKISIFINVHRGSKQVTVC